MNITQSKHRSATARFAMLLALLGPACSLSHAADTTGIDQLKKNASIYASLPQAIKDAGVIRAAIETDYPPFDFLDDHNQLIGADIDISRTLGRIMGVSIKNTQSDFSAIIPGLQSGRFDVGISSIFKRLLK